MFETTVAMLLLLHGVDGREIIVNSAAVVSMQADIEGKENKLVTAKVRCLISTADGKRVAVVESCEVVRGLIGQK